MFNTKINKPFPQDPSIPRLPPPVTSEEYVNTGKNDLFDNPMTRAAFEAMTEEQKEKYKIIGEHLYGQFDFQDEQSICNMPIEMIEAVTCLEIQLRSGLHPSMLEDNEKDLLADARGEEWYIIWGYTQKDLYEIITTLPILN